MKTIKANMHWIIYIMFLFCIIVAPALFKFLHNNNSDALQVLLKNIIN
ncbi:MAG: hypothetical protein PHD97_04030 [Bacteroidales bacterium]|nr:hypothetical protein [Bacteroidales bacterium]